MKCTVKTVKRHRHTVKCRNFVLLLLIVNWKSTVFKELLMSSHAGTCPSAVRRQSQMSIWKWCPHTFRMPVRRPHLVPVLIKGLPKEVQSQIRMKPSRIGFRFGNNQVAYSFQQLHILRHARKKRYWLIVEVVAPATLFLLSIHAMKSLGAVIDVEKSTCYMSKLQASVPLTESKNGLLLIHLKHVCKPLEAKIAEIEILTAASTSSEPIC